VNRDAWIRQLPLALAIGLRLHEAGAPDALIAVGLGIEREGVPPMLELAKAKLHRLEVHGTYSFVLPEGRVGHRPAER
jgi:hypothetical protein